MLIIIIFTYINVGWEGSAHDITVWKDSLTNSKFCFPHPPPGKYYLVDSGYPNTLGYLSPFPGTRCHMPEFEKRLPSGRKEHFNHLHSSLRMKVECSFGQLKKRWQILNHNMPQTSLKWQMAIIVVSCFTLHNFIRMQELGIPIVEHNEDYDGVADTNLLDETRKRRMHAKRNRIARQLWRSVRTIGGTEDVGDE
ncbi:Protein ALP1-like [Bienertia sinuspersici]